MEEQLDAGRSFEQIAAEVGLDPRTVGYWAKKFGLASPHAEKHAPRGPIERELLEELIAQGLSINGIAEATGRSGSTVRHWLNRHDLVTLTTAERRAVRHSLVETAGGWTGVCPRHGEVRFVKRGIDGVRCVRCRSDAVANRRRRVKEILIEEAGGCCVICGYDRVPAALEFHHVDPSQKLFALSRDGATRSLAEAREEAKKCVLLCATCHAEVEVGAASIPPDALESLG